MKKLYTFLILAIATILTSAAADKTFTINVDNPDQVIVRNPSDSYQQLSWVDGSATVTVADDCQMPVQTNDSRSYQIASVTDQNGNNVSTASQFPVDYTNLDVALVPDGGTVTITTCEKAAKVFTLIGNPEQVLVTMDYQEQTAVDGQWVLKPGDWSSISITARTGYILRSVTDGAGEGLYVYNNSVSIYAGNYSSSQTFTIESADESEVRTASFTVVVVGEYSNVNLQRSSDNQTLSLTGESTVIRFDPANETSYTAGHVVYTKSLYKVSVDGNPAEQRDSQWAFSVSDGSTVTIETEFPEVYVPVSFSFTNEGTEGAISNVQVDGSNVFNWQDADFTVKMGSSLYVITDNSNYDITSATLNGQPISTDPYQCTVSSEEPLNFVYTATKKKPYTVTVETDCPEGILLYNNYGAYDSPLDVTFDADGIAVVEIPLGKPYLFVQPVDGYIVTAIESGSETYTPGYSIYVSGDMEIFVSAEPITRDNNLTLYVQSGSWSYRNFSTGYGTSNARSWQDSNLPFGYTSLAFGNVDLPIYISGYPALYAYLNGEQLQVNYGSVYLYSLEDGAVIKMFYEEPSTYTVEYTISDDVDVEVRHDQATLIDAPSVHPVVGPTEVHITPKAAVTRESADPLVVTANDNPVSCVNGKYIVNVEGDTNIKVAPNTTVGIDNVSADQATDDAVYNLQGIRVNKDNLPAGVYIINGKKVLR